MYEMKNVICLTNYIDKYIFTERQYFEIHPRIINFLKHLSQQYIWSFYLYIRLVWFLNVQTCTIAIKVKDYFENVLKVFQKNKTYASIVNVSFKYCFALSISLFYLSLLH